MTASARAPLMSRRQWPLGAEALRDNGVLALRDGSARARFGCKGREAPGWLESRGFRVPDAANSATVDERGILVARLATSEFLIEALGAPDDDAVAEVTRELVSSPPPPGVYPVLRQDVVIELSGTGLNSLLRQICSVDFAPLLDTATAVGGLHPVVLTSMIGVSVVAWPRHTPRGASLTLWLDPSFGHYFCSNLLEVGGDIGGPFDSRAG